MTALREARDTRIDHAGACLVGFPLLDAWFEERLSQLGLRYG